MGFRLPHPFERPYTGPRPTCLLCGVEILPTDDPCMPKAHHDLYTPDWQRIWKPGTVHHMTSAYDVKDVYDMGKYPQLWGCLYRAIIKDSSTDYRLTGINTIQKHNVTGPFYAVNDPTEARIGGSKDAQYDKQVFTRFYGGITRGHSKDFPEVSEDKTIGYFIHSDCWTLVDSFKGPEINDINLAKLVEIYRSHWSVHFELSRRYISYSSSGYLRVEPICDSWVLRSRLQHNVEWPNGSTGPILPEIQEAIESAKAECYQPSSVLGILPLELRVMIAENVCPIEHCTVENVRNLKNMLMGFGWDLPAWFWRERFDERLFFELKGLVDNSSVASKGTINLMSLVANPSRRLRRCLYHRQAVLDIMLSLDETKASTK